MRRMQVNLQLVVIGVMAIVLLIGVKPWQTFGQAKETLAEVQQYNEQGQPGIAQIVPGSVYDGDTLRVNLDETEIRIRLCGIDAPEMTQPMGIAARDHLRSLLNRGNGSVIVVPVEEDRYGRTVAELFIKPRSGQDYQQNEEIAVNAQMVADGYAYHYAQYSDRCPNGSLLTSIEANAQAARRGVWSNPNAIRPWDYRHSH